MLKDALQGLHILVVEDDYFLADDLRRELRGAGVKTFGPVASVQGGLKTLEQSTTLDAASLDVNLGGEYVYPLADALIARAVPFLFTTGYDQAMIPKAYAHIRRLEKPITPPEVLTELAKLLEG